MKVVTTAILRMSRNADGSMEQVWVHSLDSLAREHRKHSLQTFLSSIRVTMILMPFILTIWPISFAHFRNLHMVKFRFFAFLLAKVMLLILPAAYIAYLLASPAILCAGNSLDARVILQAIMTVMMVLLCGYWCFHDQAQRCPNCLLLLQ